jgi:hypothetical protein
MLNNLSAEIRECYEHAKYCERQAAVHADPKKRRDFLDMEQHWLFLARSYKFAQSLTDFSDETKRQADIFS